MQNKRGSRKPFKKKEGKTAVHTQPIYKGNEEGKETLKELRKWADRQLLEYRHIRQSLKEEKIRLKESRLLVGAIKQAQRLAQEVAQKVQNEAHHKIAGIVTNCLQSIFGVEYGFRIVFERKRGRTEARMCFLKHGRELDPTDASGGGIVDVASFALRCATLYLRRPRARLTLFLDEPFRFLNKSKILPVRELIVKLSKEMGFQFIIVSHEEGLSCGKIYKIEKSGIMEGD